MRTLTILVAAIFLLAAASCSGSGRDESPSVNYPEQVPQSVQNLDTDEGRQIKALILSAQGSLSSGDLTGYYSLHSSAFRSSCPFDGFSAVLEQFSRFGSPNEEIFFYSVEVGGNSALIYYDLGGNRTSQELVREDGRWWLVPATNCQGKLVLFEPEPTEAVDPSLWKMITVGGADLSQIAFHQGDSFWVQVPLVVTNSTGEHHKVKVKVVYTQVSSGETEETKCSFGEEDRATEVRVPPGRAEVTCIFFKSFGSGLVYPDPEDFNDITGLEVILTSIDGSTDPALTGK